METTKIKVSKSDEPTFIAEKLIDAKGDVVIFSIPKFSRFGESLSNFKLIAREAEVLEKRVIIESVDDAVLEHAQKAGLESANPFLEERKKRFSDIVGPAKGGKSESASREMIELDPEDQEYEVDLEEAEDEASIIDDEIEAEGLKEIEIKAPSKHKVIIGEPRRNRKIIRPRRKVIVGTSILAGLLLLGYLGFFVLPKATITITTKKEPWTYSGEIFVDKDKGEIDLVERIIPGQVFIKQELRDFKYPATGKKFIERKATGQITVYNAYSSKSQQLVVNTRFLTPDNKIFRLTEGITVPGAKIGDGEIIPSSIVANVVADSTGAEFNVGSVARLSIPGFKDTPRYSGFYGELKEGTTGGFVGEAQVPTQKDLDQAKTQSLATLESDLRFQLVAQLPEGFKLLEDASKFTVLKQYIDANADNEGKFTLQLEAEFSAVTFKEENLLKVIASIEAEEKGAEFLIHSEDVLYQNFTVSNISAGKMSLPVKYEAQLERFIDQTQLKENLRGQSESQLRITVLGVPGIENAKIALWPFWVRTIPKNTERILIITE